MTVESIPKFTDPAAKLWATVPADAKKATPVQRLVQQMRGWNYHYELYRGS